MKKTMFRIAALAAILAGALCAQDLSGTWQGTLSIQGPQGKADLRTVIKIANSSPLGRPEVLVL